MARTDSGVYGMGIQFVNASNSWVSNVRSLNDLNGVSEHVETYQSTHITVQNSYFYGSNPASEGYGIACDFSSSDNLFINNVLHHIASPLQSQGCVGSVYAYNYAVDDFFGPGTWQQGDDHHSTGDANNLYEGNETVSFTGDDIHGTSNMQTFFRDYLVGRDPATANGTKQYNTHGMALLAYDRYYNVIGSVLGSQNYHTVYQYAATGTSDSAPNNSYSVFALGYSDQNSEQFSLANGFNINIPNDPLTQSTLMRWGNYVACTGDSACNSVRWQASEVPSGLSKYANPVPSSQSLPASFFLTSRPTWWGSMPWPAVGPDVTGGNVASVGGHVYLNPAANCFLNVLGGKSDGSSGALTFNANNCYSSSSSSSSGPPAPANLSGTVVQ